jgi:hypothetical protein
MSFKNHKALLKRSGFTFSTTDTFFVCGQSNAAQTTPAPNTTTTLVTAPGVAWGLHPNTGELLGPFQNGSSSTNGFGQSNGWVYFAETWKALTGHNSLWLPLAVAGTPLVPASIPGSAYTWSVSDLTKSLVGSYTYTAGGETNPRASMFSYPVTAAAVNPGLSLGKRYVLWVQGEADANSVPLGRLTGADYVTELNNLFTYMKTNYAIDYFLVVELGRKGTEPVEIANNEAAYTTIRAAQASVVDSRADTHFVSTAPKSTSTLTVDGSGYWVSGWDYQGDGVHYTSESYRALGKTAALTTYNLGLGA